MSGSVVNYYIGSVVYQTVFDVIIIDLKDGRRAATAPLPSFDRPARRLGAAFVSGRKQILWSDGVGVESCRVSRPSTAA